MIFIYTPAGEVITGGVSGRFSLTKKYPVTVGGRITLSGTSPIVRTYFFHPSSSSGVVFLSGTAFLNRIVEYIPSGGIIVMGGSAPSVPPGTLSISGIAEVSLTKSYPSLFSEKIIISGKAGLNLLIARRVFFDTARFILYIKMEEKFTVKLNAKSFRDNSFGLISSNEDGVDLSG